ncbi:hypothetical protein [Shimazuella alba]|uniref:Uncharacterized protein n=1 Tax=Shimazuella alba TaxID=2690964 RepID=A0A6I4VZT9_9BACL|nr:hypothetical protein [Shimazuella alba]MXQ55455.1 hypothetical protein [Shimazuella alba]
MKIWGYVLLPFFIIANVTLFYFQQHYYLYHRVFHGVALSILLVTLAFAVKSAWKKWNSWNILLFFLFFIYIGSHIWVLIGSPHNLIFMINSIGLFGIVFIMFVTEIKEQGELWFPSFLYSMDYTFLITFVITGQVVLVIWIGSSFVFETISLILLSILISILVQASFRYIQTGFEYFVFVAFPQIRQERVRVRTTESIKMVVNEKNHPEQMDEEELYHYTRRAFSHFGDLKRLSSNPLTQLKIIDQRLHNTEKSKDVLERAKELKLILLECVQQLKPQQDQKFGTTHEWRYYNSLYFPYIIGIKPYSLRYSGRDLSEDAKSALEWFRTSVPERTFYHWTNTATRLIATRLRDKLSKID